MPSYFFRNWRRSGLRVLTDLPLQSLSSTVWRIPCHSLSFWERVGGGEFFRALLGPGSNPGRARPGLLQHALVNQRRYHAGALMAIGRIAQVESSSAGNQKGRCAYWPDSMGQRLFPVANRGLAKPLLQNSCLSRDPKSEEGRKTFFEFRISGFFRASAIRASDYNPYSAMAPP